MARKYSVVDFVLEGIIPQASEYDMYYPQFVDSKEPLSELSANDLNNWIEADIIHPVMSEIPSPDRIDYFDIPFGSNPKQKLDIHHLNDGDHLRPVIIFIHGGGWIKRDKDQSRYMTPTWVSLGYTVVSINYRLATESPHPAQIEDCAMALKWVTDNIQNYGGDPNKIAVTGNSSGGHLTALLMTGTKWHDMFNIDISKVKCWIPISGINDLLLKENYYQPSMPVYINALLGNDPSKKEDASPVTHVTGSEAPSLILHGGDDWLVPRTNSIELYNKLKERYAPTELEIVNNYWHVNMIVDYDDPSSKPPKIVNKFLAKYLPTDKNK